MAKLLLAVIALPGIYADVNDLATPTNSQYGRVLNSYPPVTDANLRDAFSPWGSGPDTNRFGPMATWDVSQVTNMEQSKSIRILENDLT